MDNRELTVNGNASVITVKELTLKCFYDKQFDTAIAWLRDKGIAFTWERNMEGKEEYYITVYDMPWAENLRDLGEVLQKSDFDSECN